METRPYVPWDMIISFMTDVFEAYGVPREDAEICADVLAESDRRGIESHGCNRFKPIYLDRIDRGTLLPVTELEIVKETPTTVVADAHDGMGMVASYRVMEMLIEKAKKYGMAGGAIRNSTHYGIAGYWTGMAAKEGMVGITGTNARPSIAPTFGIENMMGTNPLTFSLPTDEEFDTLGGLIFSRLTEIPSDGEHPVVECFGLRISVEQIADRRVEWAIVEKIDSQSKSEGTDSNEGAHN